MLYVYVYASGVAELYLKMLLFTEKRIRFDLYEISVCPVFSAHFTGGLKFVNSSYVAIRK